MCCQAVQDILCSEPDCNIVIACKQVVPDSLERCKAIRNAAENAPQPPRHAHPTTYNIPSSHPTVYAQPRDWCPRIATFTRPPQKARRAMCRACQMKPVAEQNELYAELGEALAESRELQRQRDYERRAVGRGESPAGSLGGGTRPPAGQAVLVSGAGMHWQGGSASGAAGTGDYPEMGATGYPQELDYGLGETGGQGWDDRGRGSSHGYHQGQGNRRDPGRGW